MQGVFGDANSSELGVDNSMDLDDLLDAVDAKVVYFPGYACTSFIAGQAMNAYLRNRPELTPIPAPSGFSILGFESPSAICTAETFTPVIDKCSDGDMCIDGAPMQPFPAGSHLDNLQEAFSLTEDDPYLALCVRTPSLSSSSVRINDSASKSSNSEEDAGDTGNCTIDSLGPCTPPRLSYGQILADKRNLASKDHLGCIPASPSNLTEENEILSFIDFTGSFFED